MRQTFCAHAAKSVKQVEAEMRGHLKEAADVFAGIMKSNPDKAQAFFSELQDIIAEEFDAFKEFAESS